MPTVETSKKGGVMGRLKSKITTKLGRKKESTANASPGELTNQGSTPSLQEDEEDNIVHQDSEMDEKEECYDDEQVVSSTDEFSCNNEPAGVAESVAADLVVIGKSPSKLRCHSPVKRMGPTLVDESKENAPPPSPQKIVSAPPETLITSTNQEPNVKPKKSRASSFHENAPILASAYVETTEVLEPTEKEQVVETPSFDAGAAITSTFGDRIARMLGADPWGDRQDGFDAISMFVKKMDPAVATPATILTACFAAITCGVVDRVAPVMYCSLECLQHVLATFAPLINAKSKRFSSAQNLQTQLQSLLVSLLSKLNDSNKRTQREALHGIVRLVKVPKLGALKLVADTFESDPLDRFRLELIQEMINELGFGTEELALPIQSVLSWTVPALKIVDEKTRKLALEIVAFAVARSNDSKATLESIAGLKPALLKILTRRIEEIKTNGESENQPSETSNQVSDAGVPQEVLDIWTVPREDDVSITTLISTSMATAEATVGPVAWRKLESKTWSDRKEALVDIEKMIEESKSDLRDVKPTLGSAAQTQFIAYAAVIHHCLNDSIAPVMNSAVDLFTTLIKIYGPHIDWRDGPVKDLTMQCIVRLLTGMQKPNNRTSKGSCRCILKLARLNVHTMKCAVACVFSKDTEVLVQMHVLRLLVPEFGLAEGDSSSLQLNATLVLNAVTKALSHSNEKVRKSAMDVALCSQRLIGKTRILQHLKDIKPSTLKELEKNFIEVEVPTADGRPSTVNTTTESLGLGGPEVTASRRLLSSAPVAGGKSTDDARAMDWTPRAIPSSLSNEEESLMDSILGI
ncbi:hypothetical protein THRCLA_20427 [Thraustotheca clavata]|uniref:TOG domain-containing protein n=1 Tax=Thraustotheca clavata TaxID=74557 RepID=A0A1W0A795_9STRA|nr:hypothetical protein THRCLA_20427 [Thraustotheca clavata]